MRLLLILLFVAIAIVALFFYSFFNNFNDQFNLKTGSSEDKDPFPDSHIEADNLPSQDEKPEIDLDFRGPSGPPGSGFIGPKADPPGY